MDRKGAQSWGNRRRAARSSELTRRERRERPKKRPGGVVWEGPDGSFSKACGVRRTASPEQVQAREHKVGKGGKGSAEGAEAGG